MASELRKRFLCLDCGVDTGKIHELYSIKTELWLAIAQSIHGMLCIGCAEKRLGRKLVRGDFTDSFLNNIKRGTKSQRLLARLQ